MVLSHREDGASSEVLRALQETTSPVLRASDVITIDLEPLGPDAAEELARALLSEGQAGDVEQRASLLAARAEGSPIHLVELAAASTMVGEELGVDDLVRLRVDALPTAARTALELLAVAASPVADEVLVDCLAQGGTWDALDQLRTARLGRVVGQGDWECFHDRVRSFTAAGLTPDQLKDRHRALADALASYGADPEVLFVHTLGAGREAEALQHAAAAAEAAEAALAFGRAARLYSVLLDAMPADAPDRWALQASHGTALANAGRGWAAGDAFLAAADVAPASERADLRRRAAEQNLRVGRHREGTRLLKRVLREAGLPPVRRGLMALLRLVLNRVRLRLRGLSFSERSEAELDPASLARFDVCHSTAILLGVVEPVVGSDYQAQAMRMALDLGEPSRVCSSLASEAGFRAALGGVSSSKVVDGLLARAQQLADRVGQNELQALVCLATAVARYQQGEILDCHDAAVRAENTARDACRGIAWERDTSASYRLGTLAWLGRWGLWKAESAERIADAERRGDLHLQVHLSVGMPFPVDLIDDDPERCLAVVRDTLAAWGRTEFDFPRFYGLLNEASAHLYAGQIGEAWARLEAEWPKLRAENFHRVEMQRVEAFDLRARVALAGLAEGVLPPRTRGLVRSTIRGHRSTGSRFAAALATLLEAQLSLLDGRPADGQHQFVEATSAFQRLSMKVHAAAADSRRAGLDGNPDAEDAALEPLREEGVVNPSRVVAMLCPVGQP